MGYEVVVSTKHVHAAPLLGWLLRVRINGRSSGPSVGYFYRFSLLAIVSPAPYPGRPIAGVIEAQHGNAHQLAQVEDEAIYQPKVGVVPVAVDEDVVTVVAERTMGRVRLFALK